MRVFWAVLGVLMLAAAGYLFMSEGAGGASTDSVQVARGPAETPVPAQEPQAEPERRQPPAPVTTGSTPPVPAPAESAAANPPQQEQSASVGPEAPKTEPSKATEEPKPARPPEEPTAETKDSELTPGAPEAKASEAAAPAPVAEAKLVTNEDGSVTVDGKYTMRGKGTPEEPYVVSWEHLVSVQEDYSPKEGRNTIPARVSMLDGKHVQIVGNIAFPMMMDEAEECLVMLNQWDGCCIGIPPTPYDAIEVKLRHVVTGNERLTTYGSITGKLKVDPHLVGGWLVGLYVMDNATLKPQAFGGFAP